MFDSDSGLEAVPTDAIERRLVELETMIARIRAGQTRLLREIDLRQVPTGDGCRNLAEWVSSRVDVAPETAHAMVRIVHNRRAEIDDALVSGSVSFDRAVELTRLDIDATVAAGEAYSIPRLRNVIAGHRRLTRAEERRRHADRYLMLQPNLDQTSLRILGELVGVDAAAFEQVIVDTADQIFALPGGHREPRRARMADALVNIVVDSAMPSIRTGETSVASPVVSVLVDATQATATNGESGVRTLSGLRLGPAALEAILCDSIIEVNTVTADGVVLGVGDRARPIPPRIRRYIHQRDWMCTADGCASRYRLQPHHIVRHADGADNDPANLTLLCWFHHHVVIHRHGYRVDPDSTPGRLRFLPPEAGRDPPV